MIWLFDDVLNGTSLFRGVNEIPHLISLIETGSVVEDRTTDWMKMGERGTMQIGISSITFPSDR